MQRYLDQMDLILSNLFKKYSPLNIHPGVLLSGGIDSSTITYFVANYFQEYTILSMGTAATKDKTFIEKMTIYLQHPYVWLGIKRDVILSHMDTVKNLLIKAEIEANLMQTSLAMGYFLIFKEASELGITHIFTGQGPDILLGGYHKYKEVRNINEEIKKDLHLLEIDKKRDGAMASYFGITLINPYLEKKFVDFSLSIPQKYKIKDGIEKYILRVYARNKGLPEEIVNRPKQAYQYSTGIQSLVLKIF